MELVQGGRRLQRFGSESVYAWPQRLCPVRCDSGGGLLTGDLCRYSAQAGCSGRLLLIFELDCRNNGACCGLIGISAASETRHAGRSQVSLEAV